MWKKKISNEALFSAPTQTANVPPIFSFLFMCLPLGRVSLPDGVEVDEAASGGVGLLRGVGGAASGGDGSDVSSSLSSPWEVVEFSAGNPRAEIISGKMHLYRDTNAPATSTSTSTSASIDPPADGELLPEGRNEMVCVLAVPSSLSVADFCQFAAALISKVVEMRMVKSVENGNVAPESRRSAASAAASASTAAPAPSTMSSGGNGGDDGGGNGGGNGGSTYSVILRFEDQDSADSFALNYHNRRFNSFVEGACRVLFVRSIELTPAARAGAGSKSAGSILSGGGGDGEAFTTSEGGAGDEENPKAAAGDVARDVVASSSPPTPAPPPSSSPAPAPEGLTELPSCPVCLDRLDQDVSGVVTTICSHSFHASCLSKWGDSSCPVCRYTQAGGCLIHTTFT